MLDGERLICPDSRPESPRVWRQYKRHPGRASTSMRREEAHALYELIRRLLAGEDMRVWTRVNAATLGKLMRAAKSMSTRLDERVPRDEAAE